MENNENNENNPNELPEHETGAEMGNDNFTPSEYNNPPPPPPLTPPPPAYPYPQPPPYGAGYYHTPTPYPVPQYQYGGENPEWRSNKNGQIAAFVLSLLGFFAGVFTAIPGVITGVIFYKKAQKLGAPTGFSVAAIIIGTAITVINILFFALFFAILAGVYSASIVPSSAVYDVVKEGNEYYAVEKTYEGYEPEPSNDSVNIAVYKSPDNKQLCV